MRDSRTAREKSVEPSFPRGKIFWVAVAVLVVLIGRGFFFKPSESGNKDKPEVSLDAPMSEPLTMRHFSDEMSDSAAVAEDRKAPEKPADEMPPEGAFAEIEPVPEPFLETDATVLEQESHIVEEPLLGGAEEARPVEEVMSEPAAPVAAKKNTTKSSPKKPEAAKANRKKSGTWTLNLHSFLSRDNAVAWQAKMKASGYPNELQSVVVDGKEWYRVRITGLATEGEARALRGEIERRVGVRNAWISK